MDFCIFSKKDLLFCLYNFVLLYAEKKGYSLFK